MVTVRKYAQVVNPQKNPNLPKREEWKNMGNAVGNSDLYATSEYTVKSSTKKVNGKKQTVYNQNYPYKITAHKFGFDIPSNAYIKKITVGVSMKTNEVDASATFPSAGFYIKDKKASVSDDPKYLTGWHDGIYWSYSNKTISRSFTTKKYVMEESDYHKGGYSINNLNSDYFGVDLNFSDSGVLFNQDVYLQFVWCEIEYDVPTYQLTNNFVGTNTKESPYILLSGQEYTAEYTLKQTTLAKDVERTLTLNLPFGVEFTSQVTSSYNGNVAESVVTDTEDSKTKEWNVKFNGKGTASILFKFRDYTVDEQVITLTGQNPVPSSNIYIKTERWLVDGFNDLHINLMGEKYARKRHTTCFAVDSLNESADNVLVFKVENNYDWQFINCELDDGLTSDGVSIASITKPSSMNPDGSYDIDSSEAVYVNLTVPSGVEFNTGFKFCIRPLVDERNTIKVTPLDSDSEPIRTSKTLSYDVLIPYEYHITSNTGNDTFNHYNERLLNERINFTNHRIASNIDTGAFILPCKVKDGDALMIEGGSHINMYKWEALDYIGCVPLEHLHFDPKSTYKDKLLDSHYKNKRYMGKELASDEDITLNVRLHPPQVTTVQGLIDMDKPIPINANHLCFEGDALNHRGWAEIYGITAEETNPHWYKCSIDVKYLTHNLNTRFHIEKGDKTFNYSIPSLLAEIMGSGEPISEDQSTDFFVIDTDGTYAYIEDESSYEIYYDVEGNSITWLGDDEIHTIYIISDVNESSSVEVNLKGSELLVLLEELGESVEAPTLNQPIRVYEAYNNPSQLKNRFTLDEGQHISIKSRNPLSTINEISFSWLSTKLDEIKENNVSRIFRLTDSITGDVVFEYEYCDFDFTGYQEYVDEVDDTLTGILSCRVIGRKKNQEDYDTVIDENINLVTDVESADDDFIDIETQETISNLEYFGSTLHFRLNNNVLTVIDEGYNSKEIERKNIELEGNQYYYESYWVNKNTDGEDDDIISYFDIVVQDSILEAQYADKYSSLYISPFPVSNKRIVFTRKAEEGIIYYLEDDNEEFTYLIEPYYQYHNGVDLRNDSGASIFNLNYGYRVISLENGLVSLGINRLNGKMYLRRYDPTIKEYVNLFNLQLSKYDDININSISDDRIELQASDTCIIMYRGHPYVIFKHELEDIGITTKSYKVYGQSVDGNVSDYPAYFDLMNHDNLLPVCVTSKLDDDCVSLTEREVSGLTPVSIEIGEVTGTIYEGDDVTFTVTGQPSGSKVSFLIKRDLDGGFDEVGSTTTGNFTHKFDKSGAYEIIAVYVGDDTHEYSISPSVMINVGAILTPEEKQEQGDTLPEELSGNYVLTINSPSKFTYRDNQKVTFTLTKGGVPIKGKVIEMINFNRIDTATTNDDGQASFYNNDAGSHPNKYKIGARYHEGGRVVTKVYKDVKVDKATPEFELKNGASKVGNYFTVKLKHQVNDDLHYNLKKRKVSITVNGKKYERNTNENGNEFIKITKKGTYKYKCIFNGDKDYKKCKFIYREKVTD